jgi:hypothetical protein
LPKPAWRKCRRVLVRHLSSHERRGTSYHAARRAAARIVLTGSGNPLLSTQGLCFADRVPSKRPSLDRFGSDGAGPKGGARISPEGPPLATASRSRAKPFDRPFVAAGLPPTRMPRLT